MRVSILRAILNVARKELLDGIRLRAGYVTMGMFALTVIAFMSMSLAGDMPDARQAATLYWIVLFFAATLQGERLFAEEAAAGTLLFLRIYVPAQAVLFGKMAAADTLLAAVASSASVRGGLVPVLLLPSMLPILLPAIAVTAGSTETSLFGGILLYDLALTVGASILFDALWIES